MVKKANLPIGLSSTGEPDPLKDVYGKPMISLEMPGTRYLGRVVVELYASESDPDERNIAYTVDPAASATIDAQTLVKRIADALSARLAMNKHGE